MRIISLLPISKRGKQLVKQHGERWEVIKKQNKVLFSTDTGPWLYIQPLSEERAVANNARDARLESASRWVHEHRDSNFKVAP